ncbi:hypothetical protein EV122DRAFT_284991 [Schizophyllum commune]
MVTTRKAISPHEARKVVQLPVEVKQKQETDVSQPVGCAHPVVYLAPVTNLYTAPVIFKTLVMFGEQGRALFVGPVMQVIMASTAHANMEAEGRLVSGWSDRAGARAVRDEDRTLDVPPHTSKKGTRACA